MMTLLKMSHYFKHFEPYIADYCQRGDWRETYAIRSGAEITCRKNIADLVDIVD